jgi:hypothetical protein
MRFATWLLLVLFAGCCLGLGCGGGTQGPPTQTTSTPPQSDLGKLPQREPRQR